MSEILSKVLLLASRLCFPHHHDDDDDFDDFDVDVEECVANREILDKFVQ